MSWAETTVATATTTFSSAALGRSFDFFIPAHSQRATFAAELVQGKPIEEAAQEMFISEHTARRHQNRIFIKTDTHRQPELVVRLLMIVF